MGVTDVVRTRLDGLEERELLIVYALCPPSWLKGNGPVSPADSRVSFSWFFVDRVDC